MRRPFNERDGEKYSWGHEGLPALLRTPGLSALPEIRYFTHDMIQFSGYRGDGDYFFSPISVGHYEEGRILLFPSIELGFSEEDWAFLDAMPMPASDDNFYKKAKMKNIFLPLDKKTYDKHVLSLFFPDNREQAAQLQRLITRTNEVIRQAVHKLFRQYKFVGENITWRLTRTESEEIHFDSYGDRDDPNHHVRVFINLDDHPRLWGVGPTVNQAIERYPEIAKAIDPKTPPNLFNGDFSKRLPWRQVDRQYVLFPPGACWMVNSQLVAHEIVWGRKMIACTFDVDPVSMVNPENLFSNVVRKALAQIKE